MTRGRARTNPGLQNAQTPQPTRRPLVAVERTNPVEELSANFRGRHAEGRRAFYWAFYRTVSTNKEGHIEMETVQCILCDQRPAKSSGRKYGRFAYNSLNGTSNLDKHVKSTHQDVLSLLKPELVRLGYEDGVRTKKRPVEFVLAAEAPREESDQGKYSDSKPKQARFNTHCALMVTKDLYPFSLVESPVFRSLVHNLDPLIRQLSRKELTAVHVPLLDKKITEEFLQPCIKKTLGGCLQFDLWMSRGNKDIFTVIFSTVDQDWKILHLNLGLLETVHTDGNSLAEDLKSIINSAGVQRKIVGLLKDQGSNLIKATRVIQQRVSHPVIELPPFHADCLAHALNKVSEVLG